MYVNYTIAAESIRIQFITIITITEEGALSVDTSVLTSSIYLSTLINICGTVHVKLVKISRLHTSKPHHPYIPSQLL